MTTDNARPQDVGRSHSRKRSEGDAALIERWHAELRAILDRVISELQGSSRGKGLDGTELRELPSIAQSEALVRLGALASKELGAAIDPSPRTPQNAPGRPRARRADYGGA